MSSPKREFTDNMQRRMLVVTAALEELAQVASAAGESEVERIAQDACDELLDWLDYLE